MTDLPEDLQGLANNLHLISPSALAVRLSGGKFQRPKHILKISHALVEAALGKNKRIGIFCPPRHGKSWLCSNYFPVWYLTHFPERTVILASYEADFAANWGRMVRNTILENPQLGIRITEDSKAADRWHTSKGGGMKTCGVGGPLTGSGANCLLIDDPVKNSEEADSEVIRQRTWDWYLTTARTRLEPDASLVLVQTRWNADDLAGRLISAYQAGPGTEGYEDWEILSFPAVAEENDPLGRLPGEALWPERYPLEALSAIRTAITERPWNALYQQRPSALEGGAIKRNWWRFYDIRPANFDKVIQSWDLTFTDKMGSDFVVGQVWGLKGSQFYLLDQVRARMDYVEQLHAIRNFSLKWPDAHAKYIEEAANGAAVISMLTREVGGIIPVKPKGSKRFRMEQALGAAAPFIEAGNVLLPGRRTPSGWEPYPHWVVEFIEEAANFPAAAHDDQCDAMSQAIANLAPLAGRIVSVAHDEALASVQETNLIKLRQKQFSRQIQKDIQAFIKPRRSKRWIV